MNDMKNDSVFVLRLILVIAGIIMFCYSKIGTFLFMQSGALCYGLYLHFSHSEPFLRPFMASALIISAVFEITYPLLSEKTKTEFQSAKEEFDNAKEELRRRKRVSDQ